MSQTHGHRLILADGTEIENGRAGYADGYLWLWMPGYTMAEAAAVAFNPLKTGRIVYQYGEMEDEYEHFTNCTTLMVQENEIAVCLKKAEPEGNGGLNG